ncbi:MAG: dihydrodipicolinate synthase family protein [Planctomycetaceae bacterium]|nr:dihydrodipicolinate synthase family protein [Planctomycetales bacterium]MCB9925043.1 dihydrodipicolinate synthase family protein [Planctomycetaceae bacterium]
MKTQLSGVLPVVHTPFLDDDTIDWQSLEQQIDWAFAAGADGYCTGMVSELLRLTFRERTELTKRLGDLKQGRGIVVIGVGAESTKQAVEYARCAEEAGCDGIMAIPPMSTVLPAEQMVSYFRDLAEAVSLPMIVQDASSYVGQEIPLSVSIELLARYGEEKILFKPEASPIGPKLSELRNATDHKARIFEGSGGMCLVDSFRRGIVGTIPGMEFLPAIVALWKALQAGDEEATYRIYLPLCALVALQLQAGLDGFLAVEKYVLHKRGIFATDRRRRPLAWELDEETRQELERLLSLLDSAIER